MNTEIKKGLSVILKSFHGTTHPPEDVEPNENYWKLIGSTGIIMSDEKKTHPAFVKKGERVLVQFTAIEKFNLECHNGIPNSLWIFISDLSV